MVDLEQVIEAAERAMTSLDNPGFCKACGEEAEGVEPDARNCECDYCGEPEVFGYGEFLLDI